MASKDFDEFVKRQQGGASVAAVEINWEKERDEWLAHLDRLYSKIESFLKKYVSSGQIKYEYRPIDLNEENIGSYSAKQMVLRIGRQEVDLVPIGTLLIGSKGRVDVRGPGGRAQILLVDGKVSDPRSLIHVTVGVGGKLPLPPGKRTREIDWEWKILTRPPERRFIEITQQTFFDLIMEVANG
ncbi:MAG TPA: hypothetical protein VKR60_03835 [Candidatus Sulfotelmatobacter sp.]|nr:hypothetical protein [Candidatus Sulfotelmatobacter sp.]